MTVSMQTMRNIASVRGDLSGSLMDPEVVGIKGIAISGLPTSDNDTLLFNSASNEFYFSASVGDGSGLTGIQQDLTPYLTIASASATYATTGSNTFTAKQTFRASTAASAPLNIPSGSIPTSPVNGDIWTLSNALLVRLNGFTSTILTTAPEFSTTVQPIAIVSGSGRSYSIAGGSATTSGSYTAGSITLAGGAANSLQGTGGSVTIRGGTGGTASGSVDIGTTNTNAVNIGASGRTTAVKGNLTVAGNMTINGTMTSVNSTNLEITDKYILIASGATNATALNGAGIQFGSVPSEDARIIYDAVNDEMEIYPAARSAEFRGAFVGDGSGLIGVPYDIAGDATGNIVSGSEIMNFAAPRPFTMQGFSQYTGVGAATSLIFLNGVSASFPSNVVESDLVTVICSTGGSKAYFTIKGIL